jgi:hypothetical protein
VDQRQVSVSQRKGEGPALVKSAVTYSTASAPPHPSPHAYSSLFRPLPSPAHPFAVRLSPPPLPDSPFHLYRHLHRRLRFTDPPHAHPPPIEGSAAGSSLKAGPGATSPLSVRGYRHKRRFVRDHQAHNRTEHHRARGACVGDHPDRGHGTCLRALLSTLLAHARCAYLNTRSIPRREASVVYVLFRPCRDFAQRPLRTGADLGLALDGALVEHMGAQADAILRNTAAVCTRRPRVRICACDSRLRSSAVISNINSHLRDSVPHATHQRRAVFARLVLSILVRRWTSGAVDAFAGA